MAAGATPSATEHRSNRAVYRATADYTNNPGGRPLRTVSHCSGATEVPNGHRVQLSSLR